jgi:UDP-N-acetylmuramate dehydrogenase
MQFQEQFNLQEKNTFGLSVKANYYSSFTDVTELKSLLSNLPAKNLMILGGGSNVLFTQNFDGVLLRNEIGGVEKIEETEKHVFLKVGAGVVWHDFVLYSIEQNLGGVENLSLIPGSVGASPMQNIGAYGVEIKDVFHELEAYHIETGEVHTFNNESCQFGYRESVFKRALKNQYVILNVTFKLSKNPVINTSYGAINDELSAMGVEHPTIKDVSDAVIKIRQSKLPNPAEIGNAGSFFKNPVVANTHVDKLKERHPNMPVYPIDENSSKIPAGWLIEQDGWKGKRFDKYGVHAKQALVLVNYGGASGTDILNLSEQIIQSIEKNFGIKLEREVNIV